MLASTTSFATSSQTGLDPAGDGIIHLNGKSVSSCAAPTFNVSLGNIDFHTAANGATGVYEKNVDIAVTCTNPNQNWKIAPHVSSFNFSSGVNGANPEQGYVSFSAPSINPGENWGDFSDWNPFLSGSALTSFLNKHVGAMGVGTSTFTSKLTFGKNLNQAPSDINLYYVTDVNKAVPAGGVPTGTIDGRGDFAVDIPLQIVY